MTVSVFLCGVPTAQANSPQVTSLDVSLQQNQFIKGIDGVSKADPIWDEETQQIEYVGYFYYDVLSHVRSGNVSLTITYSDGSQKKWNYRDALSMELDGASISFTYTQNALNSWTAGNSYPVTVGYAGATATYYLQIIENPVLRIEVVQPSSYQFYEGEISPPESGIYSAYLYEGLELQIYYKDGTSKRYAYDEVRTPYFEGRYISIDSYSSQLGQEWTIGGENLCKPA